MPSCSDNQKDSFQASNYKCINCQKKRLKCNMMAPNCDKCTKNGISCRYSAQPPRARKPKASYIASHTSRFSLKSLGDSISDDNQFLSPLAQEQFHEELKSISQPEFRNFDELAIMLKNNMTPSSSTDSSHWSGSSSPSPKKISTFAPPTVLRSNTGSALSSITKSSINFILETLSTHPLLCDRAFVEELINLAVESFFEHINSVSPLFIKARFTDAPRSIFLVDVVISFGLKFITERFAGLEELMSTLEIKLVQHLAKNEEREPLDFFQSLILSYILSISSTNELVTHNSILQELSPSILDKLILLYSELESKKSLIYENTNYQFEKIASFSLINMFFPKTIV